MNSIRDYVAAHRKSLLVLLGAVLVLVMDAETAEQIVGAVTVVLAYLVPNDEAAVERIYGR